MFHLQDNIYFERQQNGSVRILVREGKQADAPIIKDTTVTLEGFASVVASMCAFGETTETWQEACVFLERPYPGDDEAFARWQKIHRAQMNPLCSCIARGSDGPHKASCEFWQFVLSLRRDWPGRNDYRPE